MFRFLSADSFHSLDNSAIQGTVSSTKIHYDYLVMAVGAEVQTFNIPGVKEHACFMKELGDAEKMQSAFLDCKFIQVTPTLICA